MSKIDRYNKQILQELKNNARLANTELAERVGLSPSACLRRVQELERLGIIQGYRTVINTELLGHEFTAYVTVGLGEHTKAAQKAFEQAILLADDVTECHNVTGTFEYLLRVETQNLKTYKSFHTDVLGILPQVTTISTHVVMESPKDERG